MTMLNTRTRLAAAVALTTLVAGAATATMTQDQGAKDSAAKGDQPREFGAVKWGKTLDDAQTAAAASKKPILLFFQEVPG